MKALLASLLASLAVAQTDTTGDAIVQGRVITQGTVTNLDLIPEDQGTLALSGSYQYLVGQEPGVTANAMLMTLTVSGEQLALGDGSRIFTYAQFADPIAAGKYQTFACDIAYSSDPEVTHATDVVVRNYYGRGTFTASLAGTTGTPALINEEDLVTDGVWKQDRDPASVATSYAKSVEGTRFFQTCSAARVIGVSQRRIMDFNKDIPYTVQTGYKLWPSSQAETVDVERDAPAFAIVWSDTPMGTDSGSTSLAASITVIALTLAY